MSLKLKDHILRNLEYSKNTCEPLINRFIDDIVRAGVPLKDVSEITSKGEALNPYNWYTGSKIDPDPNDKKIYSGKKATLYDGVVIVEINNTGLKHDIGFLFKQTITDKRHKNLLIRHKPHYGVIIPHQEDSSIDYQVRVYPATVRKVTNAYRFGILPTNILLNPDEYFKTNKR